MHGSQGPLASHASQAAAADLSMRYHEQHPENAPNGDLVDEQYSPEGRAAVRKAAFLSCFGKPLQALHCPLSLSLCVRKLMSAMYSGAPVVRSESEIGRLKAIS